MITQINFRFVKNYTMRYSNRMEIDLSEGKYD